jgi:hypothetical protein
VWLFPWSDYLTPLTGWRASSLSQQIRKLEDQIVQTPLFRRDKRHVELTEARRGFLPEARAILAASMQRPSYPLAPLRI